LKGLLDLLLGWFGHAGSSGLTIKISFLLYRHRINLSEKSATGKLSGSCG
jgi:hypothetical protein